MVIKQPNGIYTTSESFVAKYSILESEYLENEHEGRGERDNSRADYLRKRSKEQIKEDNDMKAFRHF